MEFKERKTAPSKDNKNYYSKSNSFYPSFVDNCTWYCWGRQLELGVPKAELSKKLPTSNAENWYKDTSYEKRNYASIGDIIVYSAGKGHYAKDGEGHVAIVEYVYDNGNLMISESGTNMKFQTRIIKPPYNFYLNVKNKKNYKLDGFIHLRDYDETKWIVGDYTLLYNKYLRTSPEVKPNNKYKWKNLTPTAKDKCIKDKLGYARYKVGAKINIKEFKYDKKGNLWGRTNTLWLCVEDKSGNQVKKA